MKLALGALLSLALCLRSKAQRADGQYWPCNPLTNATGCPPNPGLPTSTYSIDFTNLPEQSPNWTLSNYATVKYGSNGAEFTFAKRYDSPQLWTNFYIFFGRVDVVMRCAPGQGIISSNVLMSDDFDEIDWEWSGNDFGFANSKGMVQNNYFAKGITGSYDRGLFVNISSPQTTWHTYSVEWSPTAISWLIDGVTVRIFYAANADTTTHQFPQTPSKLQLGLWDGGDASENSGTVAWAGGYTDQSKAPFTMFVKSVKITNANPAYAYNYTDHSGTWQSIQKIQNPNWNSAVSSAGTRSTSLASSPILKPTIATKQDTSAAASATAVTGSAQSVIALSSTASAATSSAGVATGGSNQPPLTSSAKLAIGASSQSSTCTSSKSTSSSATQVSTASAAASSSSISSVKSSALSSVLSAAPSSQPSTISTAGNQLCEFMSSNSWFNLFNLIPFLGGNFLNFNIQCNVDYPGSDIHVQNSPDLNTCVKTCNNYRGSSSCDGCAFLPDLQLCYLKNFESGMPRAITPARKTYCALSKPYTSGGGRWRNRSAHLRRHAKGSIHRRR